MAASARRLTRRLAGQIAVSFAAALAFALGYMFLRIEAPPDPAKAFPTGEIVIGVDASFPPFALNDGSTLTGLDIDLARAIAAELDLPLRFVNIGFYSLHDALISGRVDLLISALRIDRARMDDLRYTRPYFDNGLVLAQAAGAPELNFDEPAKTRIAYEYASSAEGQIRAWEAAGRRLLKLPYERPEHALDALRLGLADAAIVDATTLRLYQRSRADWMADQRYLTNEPYATAIRIDRADAWRLVDGALETLIASGEVAIIIGKWL